MLVRKVNDKFVTLQDTKSINDTCIYQGEIIEDTNTDNLTVYLPHGYGKKFEYSKNHYYKYCGDFKNGKRDGIGTEIKKNLMNGTNIVSGIGDTEYVGEFKKDKKHGKGVLKVKKKFNGQSIYDKKWIYEGEFFNDLKHGKGVEYFEGSEKKHELNYNMGFTNSMKPYSFSNKFIDLEAFQYNKKIIGPAKIYNYKNELFYEGEFNDVIDGNGCIYYIDRNDRFKNFVTNITLEGDFKQSEFNNIYNFKGKINFISPVLDEVIIHSLIPEYKKYFDNMFNRFYEKKGFQIFFEGEFNFIIKEFKNVVFIPNGKFTFQIKYNNNVIVTGNSNINRLSKDLYGCILVPYHQQNFLIIEKEKKNELDLNSSGYFSDVSYESNDSDDSDLERNFSETSREMQNKLFEKYLKFRANDIYPSELIQKLIDNLNEAKDNNISEIKRILQNFNIKELIKQKELIIDSNAYIYDSNNSNKMYRKNELSYNSKYNCILTTIKNIVDSNEILCETGIIINHSRSYIIFKISYDIVPNQPNNNIPNHLVFYKNKSSQDNMLSYHINYAFDQNNTRYINYIGERKRDDRHGYGTEFWTNGNKRYEGEYRNNIYHGEGSLYEEENNNLIFSGRFEEGAPGF